MDICHIGQLSHWTIVTLDNCHIGQLSHWTNVTLGQCQIGLLSFILDNCHFAKMSLRTNEILGCHHIEQKSLGTIVTSDKSHLPHFTSDTYN